MEVKRSGGIQAVAVVSREGILIASDMPGDVHPETFAAMAGVMLCAAETAAFEVSRAVPDRLVVETDRGKLFITCAGERSMLVALADTGAGGGSSHLVVELNKAADRVRKIMEG